MKYLSVCSGIEAASVAWEPLGWEPVAFSEIEPFPAAVLKHRWPEVPNHGDMTKYEQWNIPSGSVDLLVGGTPCQSFSVAGLRKGLHDPRGGLMLTFLEIAQRLRPRWVVWENVPGVLSSNGGRDFGSFLGALGELGYGWAYRVLDAQWFGVAQRRRRVFVVGHLGNWEPAAKVLFESESVRRDSPPSREKGKGASPDVKNGAGTGGQITSMRESGQGYWMQDEVAGTIDANMGMSGHSNRPAVIGQQTIAEKEVVGCLSDGAHEVAPSCVSRFGTGGGNVPLVQEAVAFQESELRLTGKITEQAVCPTLKAGTKSGDTEPKVAVAFPIDTQNMTEGHASGGKGFGKQGDPSFTIIKGHSHAVAVDVYNQKIDGDKAATLTKACGGTNTSGAKVMAFEPGIAKREGKDGRFVEEMSPTLRKDMGDNQVAVANRMAVRRLTPRECERLQGFPDDHTLIPWRNKPADQCPDGPRYKALGNSMAVPCMRWIGQRIARAVVQCEQKP